VALKITRAMFVLSCLVMGLIWANYVLGTFIPTKAAPITGASRAMWYIVGGGAGCAIAFVVLFGLRFVTQQLYQRLFPVLISIVFSMMIGYLLARYIQVFWPNETEEDVTRYIYLTCTLVLVFGFIGISLGLTMSSSWESLVSVVKKQRLELGNAKLVDTSVLIDGRLKEIIDAGFIEGHLIVPRFVLKELQNIADSSDLLRRTKGRRGLDILKSLQENDSKASIEIVDDDPPNAADVDEKLVVLARQFKAKIITTDYNLNKVAQIEGVAVLNINDLANAVKAAAMPDENLVVKIIKEGKEADQGVGYLDDGTMIVVDGGRAYLGKRVSVVVTSVLQTAAGRMIFTKLELGQPERKAL
jgi:uncharacterized protein YacL